MSDRRQRLARMALPGGGVIGLAIDHRDSLRQAAARRGWAATDPELTALKRRLLSGLGSQSLRACHAHELPLIVEPVVYRRANEADDAFRAILAGLVTETLRRLAELGPDLLKVQYPGSEQACRVLHEACGAVPWVLLGGGEDAATLERQVEDACRAGASGVIVGRTVWDAALLANGEESARQVTDTSRPILRRLRQIVEAAARPVPQPAA